MNEGDAAGRKRDRPDQKDDGKAPKVLARRSAEEVLLTSSGWRQSGGVAPTENAGSALATSVLHGQGAGDLAAGIATTGQATPATVHQASSQQLAGMSAMSSNESACPVLYETSNGTPNLNLSATGNTTAASPLALGLASGKHWSPRGSMTSVLQVAQSSNNLSLPLLQFISRNQNPGFNPFLLQQRPSSSIRSTAASMALLSPAFRAPQVTQRTSILLASLIGQHQQFQHSVCLQGAAPLSATTMQTKGAEVSAAGAAAPANQPPSLPPAKALSPTAAILSATNSPSKNDPNRTLSPSDKDSILLYVPSDDTTISPYQSLARQQLEYFVVGKEDLEAGAQGRNRPIVMGQVGIRCKWCAQLPHRQKQRASTYFPAKLTGIYQTAQNITNSHLMKLCQCVPKSIQVDLQLLSSKKSGTGGGRKYWTDSAILCGIDEVDRGGLRMKDSLKAERATAGKNAGKNAGTVAVKLTDKAD